MIIGICGGSGSGKTTVANRILKNVNQSDVAVLQQDSYYRAMHDMPLELRHQINFDHPDALDNELFINHVRALRAGEAIGMPLYDYTQHVRKNETLHIEPKRIILVEGILIFADAALRELMDIKIFVDTAADIRFIRRMNRDMAERGRSVEAVVHQYLNTVRPMHEQFVEPSKRYADVIIPEGGYNDVGIDLLSARIRAYSQEPVKK